MADISLDVLALNVPGLSGWTISACGSPQVFVSHQKFTEKEEGGERSATQRRSSRDHHFTFTFLPFFTFLTFSSSPFYVRQRQQLGLPTLPHLRQLLECTLEEVQRIQPPVPSSATSCGSQPRSSCTAPSAPHLPAVGGVWRERDPGGAGIASEMLWDWAEGRLMEFEPQYQQSGAGP